MPAESRSAQRPRGWKRSIAKACDSCRRRKAKCDGARPSCSRCGLIELECVYADMAKEGAVKRRRIDPDYVLHLEERLRHVEERLSRCTTDTEDCDIIAAEAATPGSTSPRGSPSANRNGGPEQAGPSWLILDGNCQANRSSLSDQVDQSTASAAAPSQSSVLVKGQAGELRYFGPSSSMSVLSPNGLKWIAKQTSDPSLPRSLKTSLEGGRKWTGWSHPVIKPMLETKAIVPLPSWNHTIDLVNSYFESDHKALPIFHHPTFMTLLGQQYSQNATTDPCWWASINAVLAISQRRRDEQEPVPNTSAKEASWRYAKNALDVVLSILMCNTSIMSVQALTALSYYFIGTPNPQPCYFLASAAVRTAQAIGLHELAVHASIGAFERKQRQMVFWAAAILDQSTTFRTGRPAAQALHSVRVGLPRCQTGEGQEIRLSDGQSVILDTFYLYAWMAKIQSEIYHRLYSTPHESRPKKETAAVVQDLNERLESWRSAIPLQVRPGWTTKVWCLPVNLHLARLHLDYYYCIVSVHTIYGVRSYDTAQDNACSDNSALPDSSSWPSFRKCLEAAESITIVLELIPEEADSFAWAATHYSLSAFMVLFTQILQRPSGKSVRSEIKAAEGLLRFSARLANCGIESHVYPGYAVMKKLYRVATTAMGRARSTIASDPLACDKPEEGSQAIESTASNPSESPPLAFFPPYDFEDSGATYTHSSHRSDEQSRGNDVHQAADLNDPPISGLEQHDQWDNLPQMLLPFPWNWNDLPADFLHDLDMFESGLLL